LNKPRFIAGPPGTGKTHKFIVDMYMKALEKYTPEKIIILSHTNIAANEIRDAIFDLKNLKNEEGHYIFPQLRGITKKAMKHRVCTIHTYCKSRLLKKEMFNLHNHKELINKDSRFNLHREDDIQRKHRFYKYLSDADGHGETLDKYWIKCNQKSFDPYGLTLIKELLPLYEKYKKDHNLCDFSDMINNFTRQTYNEKTKQLEDDVKDPDIDMLIIDECQDCNVPQRKAIDKMARNVKEGHYYLVGDADQTLFEYSGSDAKYFHNLAANPYYELKEGSRCGEAINTYCKSIIHDVWEEYKSHRVWTPAKYQEKHKKGRIGEVIEGTGYYLPDLKPSGNLNKLLDKIKNTEETFLFTYRGTPSDVRCTDFLMAQGIEFAPVSKPAFVIKKELRAHKLWPEFIKGIPMDLTQIKHFCEYLSKDLIIGDKSKATETIKKWIKKDYTVDYLIDNKLLKSTCKGHKDFDLIRAPVNKHKERMEYIKKVLHNGFDFDKKIRVEYANIHTVKGLTYDNVIVDETIVNKDPYFTSRRLQYTAYSRGIFDYWRLAKMSGKKYFTIGKKNECL
jgi:hypothetical protein